MSIVLILTATIEPPLNAPGMARLDPQARLSDYANALTFYLSFIGRELSHIIFAENSESDISRLREIVAHAGAMSSVTFLSFQGNNHPADYGRCYGEARILDFAMSHAQSWPRDTVFWKVTGRYRVVNLRSMIHSRPPVDFYVDLRAARGRRWADLRVMAWTQQGFQNIFQGIAPALREDVRDGRPGEEAAFDILSEQINKSKLNTCKSFVYEPLIDGIRAFDDKNWSKGRQRVVYLVRSWQRKLLRKIVA